MNTTEANETMKLILEIIETLRKCTVGVEDFHGEDSQKALFARINSLIDNFKLLGQHCKNYNFDIPIAVLEYIDQAKNPSLLTKELLEVCLKSHESTNSKLKTMQRFKEVLNEELAKEFPQEYEEYRRIREARLLGAQAASLANNEITEGSQNAQ